MHALHVLLHARQCRRPRGLTDDQGDLVVHIRELQHIEAAAVVGDSHHQRAPSEIKPCPAVQKVAVSNAPLHRMPRTSCQQNPTQPWIGPAMMELLRGCLERLWLLPVTHSHPHLERLHCGVGCSMECTVDGNCGEGRARVEASPCKGRRDLHPPSAAPVICAAAVACMRRGYQRKCSYMQGPGRRESPRRRLHAPAGRCPERSRRCRPQRHPRPAARQPTPPAAAPPAEMAPRTGLHAVDTTRLSACMPLWY